MSELTREAVIRAKNSAVNKLEIQNLYSFLFRIECSNQIARFDFLKIVLEENLK